MPPQMSSWLRGATAGVVAAGAWAAVDPIIRRVTGVPYGEVRLVGRLLTPDDGRWQVTGLVTHLINGALFGATFAALGGHGIRRAVVAAQLENAALWPAFTVVDRLHPDRRNGLWPPLATDPRIIGHEVAGHAVFGVVLGALMPANRR
jgi:hypothetical protein